MGMKVCIPPPPNSWGVFESPHSRVPQYRSMLAPTPWIFRSDPNKPLLVLLAMLAIVALAGFIASLF